MSQGAQAVQEDTLQRIRNLQLTTKKLRKHYLQREDMLVVSALLPRAFTPSQPIDDGCAELLLNTQETRIVGFRIHNICTLRAQIEEGDEPQRSVEAIPAMEFVVACMRMRHATAPPDGIADAYGSMEACALLVEAPPAWLAAANNT